MVMYIIITLIGNTWLCFSYVIASSHHMWQKFSWPSTFVVEFPSQNFKNYYHKFANLLQLLIVGNTVFYRLIDAPQIVTTPR